MKKQIVACSIIFCLVALFGLALASSPYHSSQIGTDGQVGQDVAVQNAVQSWRAIARVTSADGAKIADPYGLGTFQATLGKECRNTSGRVLVCGRGNSILEVMALGNSAGATITFQIWDFDATEVDANMATADMTFPLGGSGMGLGLAYPTTLDGGVDEVTATLSSTFTQKLKFSQNAVPYRSSTGTTYYVSPRVRYEMNGSWAVFGYVTGVGAATDVVLLARAGPRT